MNDQPYLAITALEDFWDTNKPMLFLGEWCLRYDRRSFWEMLDGQLIDEASQDAEAAQVVYVQLDQIYERILPLLAEALNSIHGTSYSVRYWRIVVGPWLQTYVPVIYDRYENITRALNKLPDMTTTVLSDKSFKVPLDTLDHASNLSEDLYNLQIYSKILQTLGKEFPDKETHFESSQLYNRLTRRSLKQRLLGAYTFLRQSIGARIFPVSVVLRSSYFPRHAEFRLLLSFLGRAVSIRGLETKTHPHQYDPGMREKIREIGIGDDEFSKCLSGMLFSDIPVCFVEGFESSQQHAQKHYPGTARAIFSANAWYYDEAFKLWAAGCADDGSLLLGTPHGGSYGAQRFMPSVKHETTIVDYYYSWGWERDDCAAKVVPMPANKFVGIGRNTTSNKKPGILWVTTTAPRYVAYEFPHMTPVSFRKYLHWHKRFAESLSSELLQETSVRAHYQDFGWDIVSRLKESIPDLTLDSWDRSFIESMDKYRLCVCDHFSTTFADALVVNNPTILFWDPEANQIRPEAKQYFDLLRSNGILFDTPESAAEAVDSVYDDVESWWNESSRQQAVSVFCERFCRTSPDAMELWTDELHRVAGDNN